MPRKAKEKDIENEVINKKESKSKSKSKSTASTTKTTIKSNKKDDIVEKVDEIKPMKKTSRKKKVDVDDSSSNKSLKKEVTSSSKSKTAKKTTSSKKVTDKANTDVTKKAKETKTVKSTTSTKASKLTTSSKPKAEKTPEKKSTTKKKAEKTPEKKSTTKKKAEKTLEKKSTTSTKRTTSSTSKSKTVKAQNDLVQVVEYYDLPYSYGNTMVKLLAQTPKTLFVYWEVSDLDIKNFKEKYGENFFNITKPILIVKNLTLNKTTEIEINDFANCWYLNTEDSDCKFDIELARKFIQNTDNNTSETKYLPIAKSNTLLAPNDHIMFEKLYDFITFTDTSTGETIKKNIKSFSFLKDLYDFYKNMYNDEILKNPSSNFNF